MGASDRRKLWICRFAWTTQTRCPHTHSSDRKKRRKRLEDSFEEEENRNGRCLYTLISTVPGPSDGVHLTQVASVEDQSKIDTHGRRRTGNAPRTRNVQHLEWVG